jgi:hypothetical protein
MQQIEPPNAWQAIWGDPTTWKDGSKTRWKTQLQDSLSGRSGHLFFRDLVVFLLTFFFPFFFSHFSTSVPCGQAFAKLYVVNGCHVQACACGDVTKAAWEDHKADRERRTQSKNLKKWRKIA